MPSYTPEIQRRADLKRRYAITPEELTHLEEAVNKACQICGRDDFSGLPGNRLHIDHDHEDTLIRGLLCAKCNRALGLFQDDPTLLQAAGHYLATAKAKTQSLLNNLRSSC